jgi:DNA-binding NarL/FixJ family response regulator
MGGATSSGGVASGRVSSLLHGAMPTVLPEAESPNGRGPRVLIIDNNLLTAESVAAALTQLNFNARFAIPATPEHLRGLAAWQPHVALLDIDSVSTFAAVACIRALCAEGVPTAVVATSFETPLAGESVQAGAISVVQKGTSLAQLVDTLMRIIEGREVLAEPTKRALLERRGRLAGFEILTYREKFVLSQLMDGQSADAIARGSCVSVSTVRSQIKAILQKLGVNSQLAAASLARQVGWMFAPSESRAYQPADGDLQNR